MESGSVTTPFGRRPMSLGMLATQYKTKAIEAGTSRDKWKLFRTICEARPYIGVTDRALTVLEALLTFLPDTTVRDRDDLIVFPSNEQLSLRARGMRPATLRRHLAVLVEAGLIIRRDSPNGKRYARRGMDGQVSEAFGFGLSPLLARAAEFEQLAAQVIADRQLLRVTKERLTLCRRDVSKLIEIGLSEDSGGDWQHIAGCQRELVARIPRLATVEGIVPVLDEMEMLRAEVLNRLEIKVNESKIIANESQTERHIQDSNPDSLSGSEPRSETKQRGDTISGIDGAVSGQQTGDQVGVMSNHRPPRVMRDASAREVPLKAFPLALVLQACPEIAMYGPGGSVRNWRDLQAAAVVVRSTLGISASAYQHACEIMGPENAATVAACILERAGHINSAGGYLRDLTRRTAKGEFAIGPMLMALARTNRPVTKAAGYT